VSLVAAQSRNEAVKNTPRSLPRRHNICKPKGSANGRNFIARYKQIDTSQRFLAVDIAAQFLTGSFEHALDHFNDDEASAPASAFLVEALRPL
jgi:hypothetical protein